MKTVASRCSLLLTIALKCALAASANAAVSPTFADRYDYPGCSAQANVAAADIDGDGIPDLVCGAPNGSVNTLLGNGDGTFQPGPASSLSLVGSTFLVLLDLNGDGKADLIGAGAGEDGAGFVVSFGNGDGTFQPGTFYQTGNDHSGKFVVTGDFNGDGIIDFATEAESGIWLFTGKGGGLFNAGVLTPVSQPDRSYHLLAVDLTGNGKLDIIATIVGGVTVLLGDGDGTFRQQMDISTPIGFISFAAGDLNGDGRPDLFVVGQRYHEGFLYLGAGDGTFTLTRQVDLKSGPSWVALADLNSDGFLDIISGGSNILFGNGAGYFSAPVYYPINSNGNAPYTLPFDLLNNGRNDLVFVNSEGGLSVLLNAGKGRFEDGISVAVSGGHAYCGVSADFNGDGTPDMAVEVDGGISILLGTGSTSSPYKQGQLLPLNPYSCPVEGDLNGDEIADLLITSRSNTVVVFLGNGDGTFARAAQTVPISTLAEVALGDFNGDGKIDIALTSNQLAYGNGDGTFQTPVPYIPQVIPGCIAAIASARLNADRKTDIVLADECSNIVYVLLAGSKGGFTQTSLDTVSTSNCKDPYNVVLADADGDGHKDLLLNCSGLTPIYTNNGSGAFTYSGVAFGGGFPLVSDVNGDGIADVVVQQNNDSSIFVGEGSLTFTLTVTIGTGEGQILAVDAHGQRPLSGRPDLITPAGNSGMVEVFLNTTE